MPSVNLPDLSARPKMLVDETSPDEHFEIQVDYIGASDQYGLTLAQDLLPRSAITASGASLCDALHELANIVEEKGLHRSDRYDPDATSTVTRARRCEYCAGRFFFAETQLGKFMPVDAESVPIAKLGDTRGYKLSAPKLGKRTPQVIAIAYRHHGAVWIAHPVVCGASPEPPANSPYLLERWEANRGATLEQTEAAARDIEKWLTPESLGR